mmetsp:Transcript_36079/g.84274  ORF Transcript_36079/g.84274 Transcript_36079/m.84274 type:complete len:110 (-) Transcript_36079:219-548(-)
MLRAPLLSTAQCLSKIFFAPGRQPTPEHIHRILRLCERVHKLGDALKRGESPFDREMDKAAAPVGQQKDMGGTVLRFLRQVIAHPALGLGPHSAFEGEYPFLRQYWSNS